MSKISKITQKAAHRWFLIRKDLGRLSNSAPNDANQVLFIIGCQRSGTTLMTEILEKDWDVKVYPEHSPLSNQDSLDGLRLNPLPEVKRAIEADRYPLVVLKPLVETQNADGLLDFFPQARAIWMYRHYRDVANSNLKRFGMNNGRKNLAYIARNDITNWRAERLPVAVRELVLEHYSVDMDPYDAAALFWYVRNTFFFDLQLDQHPRVMTCRYVDLVSEPRTTVQTIYDFAGQPYPGDHILSGIHTSSIGRGQNIPLSPEIEQICESMWSRLEEAAAQPAIPTRS